MRTGIWSISCSIVSRGLGILRRQGLINIHRQSPFWNRSLIAGHGHGIPALMPASSLCMEAENTYKGRVMGTVHGAKAWMFDYSTWLALFSWMLIVTYSIYNVDEIFLAPTSLRRRLVSTQQRHSVFGQAFLRINLFSPIRLQMTRDRDSVHAVRERRKSWYQRMWICLPWNCKSDTGE